MLEENKTEGSDNVRGARMTSLCDERRHHRDGDSELRVERLVGASHGKIRAWKVLDRG